MREAWRRWRVKPRRTLRRLDLPRLYVAHAIFVGAAWVIFLGNAWAVVTGTRTAAGDSGWAAVVASLAWLAVASALTWLVVMYLRRPLLPEDDRLTDRSEQTPGDRARTEAERTAWRSR